MGKPKRGRRGTCWQMMIYEIKYCRYYSIACQLTLSTYCLLKTSSLLPLNQAAGFTTLIPRQKDQEVEEQYSSTLSFPHPLCKAFLLLIFAWLQSTSWTWHGHLSKSLTPLLKTPSWCYVSSGFSRNTEPLPKEGPFVTRTFQRRSRTCQPWALSHLLSELREGDSLSERL